MTSHTNAARDFGIGNNGSKPAAAAVLTIQQKEQRMAIAGSSTVAYTYEPHGNTVRVIRTTRLRSECATVADAVSAVLAGYPATVAGDDAWALREALVKAGKAVSA